jgi:predicted lipoprotein with Yx(FWY)xxD motif
LLDGIPVFTADRAGGRARTGLHIDAKGTSPTRVGYTALRLMGIDRPSWGADSNNLHCDLRDRGLKEMIMQRHCSSAWRVVLAAAFAVVSAASQAGELPFFWQASESREREAFLAEELPPGIQVVHAELHGPVFATAEGKTLYIWPLRALRNGAVGDRRTTASTCDGTIYRETAGLMSPYPPGYLLPEAEKRRSCEELWPPVIAGDDAKPIGKWKLSARSAGQKQWSYDGFPVYTSHLDRQQGDVLGGNRYAEGERGGETGALRFAIGPRPDVPPELKIRSTNTGRIVVNQKGFTVYASKADSARQSNCNDACRRTWSPVLAPQVAREHGEWTVLERSPGIKQWVYRGQPLYIYIPEAGADARGGQVTGNDVPGWYSVFTQRALPPPDAFTVQDVRLGQVLADTSGKTVYVYNCNDDAMDQQSCNHPTSPQAYRMAICGNGDPALCLKMFPYVIAASGARSRSRLWSVMTIDQNTGRLAIAGQPGVIRVWAYRDRPVYTFARDRPGDTGGDAWGEFNGYRNGFKAFWLRDDYRDNAFGS